MTTKAKVKVIKKADLAPPKAKVAKAKGTRIAAREMVSTVSDWVSEFKTRRSDETRAAFDKFFSNRPQPSES